MASPMSPPIPLSRSHWLRVADGVVDDVQAGVTAVHDAWQSWQASRRRAAEFRMLRELSPGVLRDIGADPEWVSEAQRWREQRDAARDAFLRGL